MMITTEQLIFSVGKQGLTAETVGELENRLWLVKRIERQASDLALVAMVEWDTCWKTEGDGDTDNCVSFDREEGRVVFWKEKINEGHFFWKPAATGERSELVWDGILSRLEAQRWEEWRSGEVSRSFDLNEARVYFGDEPFGEIEKWSRVVDQILDSVPERRETVIKQREYLINLK